MSGKFDLVKQYLFEMEIPIVSEDPEEELVIVEDEENGVKNLVIDCEAPILVLEQVIMRVPDHPSDLFERLLKWNREMVHGAFALDEDGKMVLFRDTLQLENLDRNELDGFVRAGLVEHGFVAYDDDQDPPIPHFFAWYRRPEEKP